MIINYVDKKALNCNEQIGALKEMKEETHLRELNSKKNAQELAENYEKK